MSRLLKVVSRAVGKQGWVYNQHFPLGRLKAIAVVEGEPFGLMVATKSGPDEHVRVIITYEDTDVLTGLPASDPIASITGYWLKPGQRLVLREGQLERRYGELVMGGWDADSLPRINGIPYTTITAAVFTADDKLIEQDAVHCARVKDLGADPDGHRISYPEAFVGR